MVGIWLLKQRVLHLCSQSLLGRLGTERRAGAPRTPSFVSFTVVPCPSVSRVTEWVGTAPCGRGSCRVSPEAKSVMFSRCQGVVQPLGGRDSAREGVCHPRGLHKAEVSGTTWQVRECWKDLLAAAVLRSCPEDVAAPGRHRLGSACVI